MLDAVLSFDRTFEVEGRLDRLTGRKLTALVLDVDHALLLVHETKPARLAAREIEARIELHAALGLASFVDDVDHAGFLVE